MAPLASIFPNISNRQDFYTILPMKWNCSTFSEGKQKNFRLTEKLINAHLVKESQ